MRVWTDAQKQKQRDAIKRWVPWARLTGPRTAAGKAKAARNSLKSGHYTREVIARNRRFASEHRNARHTIHAMEQEAQQVMATLRSLAEKRPKQKNELLRFLRSVRAAFPRPRIRLTRALC